VGIDQWIAACLGPLAVWILLSGLDDLLVSGAFLLFRRFTPAWPAPEELAAAPRRRIAILVPLWREHDVIGPMLEHNVLAIRYDNYDIFTGIYPNDLPTRRAVEAVAARHPRIHVALCPHPGPTSKADCLNHIYLALRRFEDSTDTRFSIVVTHDAEDLIHPDSLAAIDFFAQRFDMVQIPVLPLPTPARQLIHGLYCDEFAEYQCKDIPVRQRMGGFVPSNGVGTGFTRDVLELIAASRHGRAFAPECLTEDYENGWAVHALGRPQVFVPLARRGTSFAATREFFPSTFAGAVRQRARWVTGIALQGWERLGWPWRSRQCYWLWRDRKGLLGNLLAPGISLLFLYTASGWLAVRCGGGGWGPAPSAAGWWPAIFGITFALSVCQLALRTACSARIYGLTFALLTPLRLLLGNCINWAATVVALWNFAGARVRRRRLAWGKTEHQYPRGAHLKPHTPRLGEILVRMRCLSADDLARALARRAPRRRIGEQLVESGAISERNLYEALSSQTGLPLEEPQHAQRAALRLIPPPLARRCRVLPVRIHGGAVDIGAADLPEPHVEEAVRQFSSLRIRWCLLTPARMERLRSGSTAPD
jgi:bacteriophage N4 adsorption protein B